MLTDSFQGNFVNVASATLPATPALVKRASIVLLVPKVLTVTTLTQNIRLFHILHYAHFACHRILPG